MPAAPPLITVVVPAYNRAATIGRALRSVFAQTFSDFEIIVVDDGSSDGTEAACRAFRHPAVRVLRHSANRGAAAARNTGLRAARGTYIALLDSDDEWVPPKLARQIEQLRVSHPIIKAGCTGYTICDTRSRRDYYPQPASRERLLMGCDLSPGSTLMLHRSLLDEVGWFDETFPRYEDWDWMLRYVSAYPMGVVSAPLAIIHYSPHRSADAIATSAERLLKKYDKELLELGAAGRKARGLRWLEVARYCAMEHRFRGFSRFTAKAFREYPWYRPGITLLFIDAWLGTNLAPTVERLRARWLPRS